MNYKSIKKDDLLRIKTDEFGFAKSGDVVKVVEITDHRLTVRNVTFKELTFDFTILAEDGMDLFEFAGGVVGQKPVDELQDKVDRAAVEAVDAVEAPEEKKDEV